MLQLKPASAIALEVRRVFAYPRARVFRAWTDPASLKAWFHPAAQLTTPLVEMDLRVGGRYRIMMQSPDQHQFIVSGVYQLIEPPAKLVFSWRWEHETSEPETLVTLNFIERSPHETELVLNHTGFSSQAECHSHQTGWQGTVEQLAVYLV